MGIFLFLIYIYDSKQAACNYNLVASSGALAQWYEKVFVSIQFVIGIDQQWTFISFLSWLDTALDEPLRDDGFGGEGVDFLADGFGDELGGDALVPGFDDLPTTVGVADVTLEPVDTKLIEDKESPVTEPVQEPGRPLPFPQH